MGVEDGAERGSGLGGLVNVVAADVRDVGGVGVERCVAGGGVQGVLDQDLERGALLDGPADLRGADAVAGVFVGGAERGFDLGEALGGGAGERGGVEGVGAKGSRMTSPTFRAAA
ncbi:hypothetical protein ACFCZV_24560 [Streptomyces hydrogenans]|uniref:hypothetical protein n=1 Tax=Streptomyces hydrogenans TaxID=1873719 RepID=UPI0035D76732